MRIGFLQYILARIEVCYKSFPMLNRNFAIKSETSSLQFHSSTANSYEWIDLGVNEPSQLRPDRTLIMGQCFNLFLLAPDRRTNQQKDTPNRRTYQQKDTPDRRTHQQG